MKKMIFGSIAMLSMLTFAAPADAQRSNPLIEQSALPYGSVPFDKLSAADYVEAVREGIARQQREFDAIVNNPEAPTFENTIVALDRSGALLSRSVLALGNLEHALGDTLLMNAMTEITPLLSEHEASALLNEPLWQRIKTVYDNRNLRSDLTPEQQRLLSETYLNYALNGANLQGADREKYRRLNAELSDLNVKFAQNVTNDMKNPDRRLWVRSSQLGGLPESIKAAARAEAREALEAEGKADDADLYLFTVFYPSYAPFMKYAEDRALREQLYRLYNTRNNGGEFDNSNILKDIANIRLEIARLMGKETFADYQLQQTMAKNPENVYKMLEDLRVNYTPAMQREIREITDYARQTEGPDFVLMPWDYSFWSDRLKNERYAFNDEDMRPYFELENTIKGVFGLATKLYGYTFKENKEVPVYHPDVKAYDVYAADGKRQGLFFCDFFYRPGKAPGAWMTEFQTEYKDDNGEKHLPIISLVTNFSRPVGNDPVLLTPSEVETFLHEFGHSLHGLSADANYVSLSGTNVYHDFVELFSQFNENFLTEKQFLDSFARHYKTGKKMPADLIAKFIRASQYAAAYACMRQLGFGYLDMAYHTIREPLRASASVFDFEKNAVEPVKVFEAVEGCELSPAFGHVFSGGYAAGYYGYKWSEELDADAFSAFKKNGIFDKKTAAKFLKMMKAGGTVDPAELYRDFRGRDATSEALMIRDGIK